MFHGADQGSVLALARWSGSFWNCWASSGHQFSYLLAWRVAYCFQPNL